MRKVILLLCLCVISYLSYADSLDKRYLSYQNPDGMLYFFVPQKMAKCDGNYNKYKMEFDITYLTDNPDSVSFTSTIIINKMEKIDSVTIISGATKLKLLSHQIYCDPKRSRYISRNRCYMTWAELKNLYSNTNPYIVDFGQGIKYSFEQSKWDKERSIVNQIIQLIDFNNPPK